MRGDAIERPVARLGPDVFPSRRPGGADADERSVAVEYL